jgi:hypothetical protein
MSNQSTTPKNTPAPQKQRMATAFAVSLMANGADSMTAAANMFKGNICAQDVAEAAGWLLRVALVMKELEEARATAAA